MIIKKKKRYKFSATLFNANLRVVDTLLVLLYLASTLSMIIETKPHFVRRTQYRR